MQKRFILSVCICFVSMMSAFSQSGTMSSVSRIDWTKQQFVSSVSFDTEKAGISLPSGKNAATESMYLKLPALIKDPLLSLYVDNAKQLGDFVLDGTLTLKEITDIVYSGKMTSAVFKSGKLTLSLTNTIAVPSISGMLLRQRTPYAPPVPIASTASRTYSGIVIDARGKLPVHGEYVKSVVSPCFFPRIWDENMDLIYERDMASFDAARLRGIVLYGETDDIRAYHERIGYDPLYIKAYKVYGKNRTDPVIRTDDALRILTVEQNRALLKEGKVVVILDKGELVHDVSAPLKDDPYYAAYDTLRREITGDGDTEKNQNGSNGGVPDTKVDDGVRGIVISIANVKFIPDSTELLPSEKPRIERIASSLKEIIKNNDGYTILVEGHTADVGKPEGQMNLSIERTKTIMHALIADGIPASLFSYRGYGGMLPAASNDTEEGRRQNRRVVITVRPKDTYIQRDY
ncbi:OmpA family protein [Treponema socranskii]|uniref:OmpA family protein n=1 Tax=Treponema socranskii TaxID=53419 RepID=UPI003D8C2CFE